MTVILKHFKACIFPTVGPIFMKFLPSIMVCKKLSAKVTLMFWVQFPLKLLIMAAVDKMISSNVFGENKALLHWLFLDHDIISIFRQH